MVEPSVNEVRVAILIAMPSPREDHHVLDADHHTPAAGFSSESNVLKNVPGEIQIGLETLPWRES